MMPNEVETGAAALDQRAMRFRLASLSAAYPPSDLSERVEELRRAAELTELELPGALNHLNADAVSALQSAYIDLFDRREGGFPLYETEYGRGRSLGKGSELADLSGFYRAFGLELGAGDSPREMPDHLSVELEFYAWLLLKEAHLLRAQAEEGVSIVEDARAKFLRSHLGPFACAVAERSALSTHAAYRELIGFCAELVAGECASMGVEVEALPFLPNTPEPEAVECGAAAFEAPGPRPGRLPVLPPDGA